MRKGKFARRRGVASKVLVMLLAVAMIVGISVGGTLAWLSDKTTEVKNTFSDSTIDIELTETTEEYDMVPGWTIDKDPVVTVKAGSEDCWVFIEVNESENLDDFIAYEIDSANWTQLEEGSNVYYCYCLDITADRKIKVLGPGSYTDTMGTTDVTTDDETITWSNMEVGVKPSVTKQMMDALKADSTKYPTLTFTAYAVQYWKDNTTPFDVSVAWAKVNGSTSAEGA